MTFHAIPVFAADPAPLSVAVLLLDETSLMVVAATIDPMRAANRFAGRGLFSWTIATPDGEPARLTSGSLFPAQAAFRDMPKADVLIVLAGFNHQVHAGAALIRHLRRTAPLFRAIGSVDAGGWVLARAGLLDGQRAVVHPEDAEDFARSFPAVEVVAERLVIGPARFSAAGGLPAFELMMTLIRRRYGAILATQIEDAFVRDRPGAAAGDGVTDRAAEALAQRMEEPPGVEDLARLTGVSRRTLEYGFRKRLGTSPARHGLALRLQAAARLARDTLLPFSEIAVRTGFSSQSVFSRTFRAHLGQSPRDYRRAEGTLRVPEKK